MGATTLYHPISLTVLRGCAAWGGFRFGRIMQYNANFEKCTARYRTELVEFGCENGAPLDVCKEALQACFMEDVRIVGIWQRRSGKVIVEFTVEVSQADCNPRIDPEGED